MLNKYNKIKENIQINSIYGLDICCWLSRLHPLLPLMPSITFTPNTECMSTGVCHRRDAMRVNYFKQLCQTLGKLIRETVNCFSVWRWHDDLCEIKLIFKIKFEKYFLYFLFCFVSFRYFVVCLHCFRCSFGW